MVRVRCTGGYISPKQLQQVCTIAQTYDSNLIHITTRQEIQFKCSFRKYYSYFEDLYNCGLSSREVVVILFETYVFYRFRHCK
jgi:sulfite reductase (ferredoxin)